MRTTNEQAAMFDKAAALADWEPLIGMGVVSELVNAVVRFAASDAVTS